MPDLLKVSHYCIEYKLFTTSSFSLFYLQPLQGPEGESRHAVGPDRGLQCGLLRRPGRADHRRGIPQAIYSQSWVGSEETKGIPDRADGEMDTADHSSEQWCKEGVLYCTLYQSNRGKNLLLVLQSNTYSSMNYMCRSNDKFLGVPFVCKCMYLVGDKIHKSFIKPTIVTDFCDPLCRMRPWRQWLQQ